MTRRTGRYLLIGMGAVGWFLASVFGVLVCMLASESQTDNVPWQILGALVLGSMVATIPLGIIAYAAARAFPGILPASRLSASNPNGSGHRKLDARWRWTVFAALCGLESLVLPLSFVAAAADDDTLLLSVPFNVAIIAAAAFVAFSRRRQRALSGLCIVHLIGISGATIAAAIEIESVIVSGLVLIVTGIALAALRAPPNASRLVLAISTISFIVISTLVIAIGGFGPYQAEGPLFAAMVAYQILFAPVGLWILYGGTVDRTLQFRPQISLRQILSATLIFSVACGLARLAYSVDQNWRIAMAVGLGALVAAGVLIVMLTRGRTMWQRESGRDSGGQPEPPPNGKSPHDHSNFSAADQQSDGPRATATT